MFLRVSVVNRESEKNGTIPFRFSMDSQTEYEFFSHCVSKTLKKLE